MEPDSSCTWCGRALDPGDSWLLSHPAADRHAAFCRLEHIVPWAIRGPRWLRAAPEPPGPPGTCARCGEPLPRDGGLVLVRRRGPHRIVDAFCTLDHLAEWAKAGGPWAR